MFLIILSLQLDCSGKCKLVSSVCENFSDGFTCKIMNKIIKMLGHYCSFSLKDMSLACEFSTFLLLQ